MCNHSEVQAQVSSDKVDDIHMLCITVSCKVCKLPFQFLGQRGVAFDRPMVDMGRLGNLALSAPAQPASGGQA